MMKKILVINAGSSSIKWQIFTKEDFSLFAQGLIERIGISGGFFKLSGPNGKFELAFDVSDHKSAMAKLIQIWLEQKVVEDVLEIEVAGFRIVHGGSIFRGPTKLDDEKIAQISQLSKFAPLHNPGAVQTIVAIQQILPNVKLAASFDTAFHADIPAINYTYAIDQEFAKKYGIKKYGFHGISHKFITNTLEKVLSTSQVNYVNMHIGNGASLAAIKESKSFDTTMGLTPLAGVMMGTRSGDIDPSIHLFAAQEAHLSIEEFTDMLNKKSGLLGVSGISSDMRDLITAAQSGDQKAKFALELYAQKIVNYLVDYINKVGKNIQALVFTGGVGENSAFMRELIISKVDLPKLNIKIDTKINNKPLGEFAQVELVSSPDSDIPVYVIKTNEELLIAQNAIKSFEL
ncbi:acetate/propionate family kinase [Mesomycoplasma conjunctivae]